jgi:hypothetical protein
VRRLNLERAHRAVGDVSDREVQVLTALFEFSRSPYVADDLETIDARPLAVMTGMNTLELIECLGVLKRRSLVCKMAKGWRLSRAGREWLMEAIRP